MSPAEVARFWSHVDATRGSVACWPWSAARDKDGYGLFKSHSGKMVRAHRVSSLLRHGQPPINAPWALHRCNDPSCVNPLHLYWGNAKENRADSERCGRAAKGDKTGKLNRSDVRSIIARLDAGESRQRIAADYGRTVGCICHIDLGRTWSWLTGRGGVRHSDV